jgi:hypothetical protein
MVLSHYPRGHRQALLACRGSANQRIIPRMSPKQIASVIVVLNQSQFCLGSSQVTRFEYVYDVDGTPETVIVELHDSGRYVRHARGRSRYRCDIFEKSSGERLVATNQHFDRPEAAVKEAIRGLFT